MARLSGVDLPKSKRIDIALTYIYGIGRSSGVKLCEQAGIESSVKTDDLTESVGCCQHTTLRVRLEETRPVAGYSHFGLECV